MALRTMSHAAPQLTSWIFCVFMMSMSCARTSRALRMPLTWMKWSLHQSPRYPLFFHWLYVCRRVRWSLSGTKNFSRAASDSSARSLGRKNTLGTLSMLTMVNTSLEHPSSSPTMSILARAGSRGNSTILFPMGVSAPVLSSAPRIQSWYMLLRMLSCGGGSMKSNSSRFSMPRDLSSSTTLPRLVRWISGTVFCSISCRYCPSVKSR
mmetsp:Transcript_24293/g.76458  ORF Transcript_24293/g.76458 Transcript_24293/m.76458 type:complete len:208 (-) Transcript_24293:971-1594(-)